MDHNPYDLKKHNVDWKEKEKPPAGYLDTDAFLKFLNRKGVKIDRTDNLPRFGDNNKIKMIKSVLEMENMGLSQPFITLQATPKLKRLN